MCGDKECGIVYERERTRIDGNLRDEEVFYRYREVSRAPEKIIFARLDVADPEGVDDDSFAFTAERLGQDGHSSGQLCMVVPEWNKGLVDWVVGHHELKDTLGRVDTQSIANRLSEL